MQWNAMECNNWPSPIGGAPHNTFTMRYSVAHSGLALYCGRKEGDIADIGYNNARALQEVNVKDDRNEMVENEKGYR